MSSTSFLGSNNTNIMYMQYNSGYIGIGAYDPSVKLDVAGDIYGRSNMRVGGIVSLCNLVNVANTSTFGSNMVVNGIANFSNIVNVLTTSFHGGVATFSNNMVFARNGSVTVSTSNNNLGISKVAPEEKLDVVGKIQTSSQFLAPLSDSSNLPGYTFTANSNTGMFNANTNMLGFSTGGSERVRIDDNGYMGIGVSNPTVMLDLLGDGLVRGTFSVSNVATFSSNVTIKGELNVQSVTVSNVYVYSTETNQSNLRVTGPVTFESTLNVSNITSFSSNVFVNSDFVVRGGSTYSNDVLMLTNNTVRGITSFSNLVRMGSNNGVVEFSASNGLLGVNLNGVVPRADLDISNGNILSKNLQRLSKHIETSNPLAVTINWDNDYNANNLYYIVADVYQSIANGDHAGFRNQRIGIALSNSSVAWTQAIQVFGSSNAYTTLDLSVASTTSKSITLQSSTNWTETGSYAHGVNVDIVHFPYTSNIGNIYLT